jgi:hypothetical protein
MEVRPALARGGATFALAGTLLLLGACADRGPGTSTGGEVSSPSADATQSNPAPTASTTPTGPSAAATEVVAQLRFTGGFAANRNRTAPPALVVYADGTAVADGKQALRLDDRELEALLDALRADLAAQPAAVSPSGYAINDAMTASLSVLTADGTRLQTVTANGLQELPGAFPPRLVDALDRLTGLAAQVRQQGTPHTPSTS